MSMSLVKLILDTLGSPTSVAILGSVGVHVLLGASLPALSVFSQGQSELSEVPIVELTPEELARVPALEPAPAMPFIPPTSTQLLPLPNDFELPSASKTTPPMASLPSTPAKPSSGAIKNSSGLSTPDRIITRSTAGSGRVATGLPGRPTTGYGRRSTNSVNLGDLLARARVAPAAEPPFQPDPNKRPEEAFRESVQTSIEQRQTHGSNEEIAQLEPENSTKTPAGNITQESESGSDPAAPTAQQRPETPESQSELEAPTRDRNTPEDTENQPESPANERQSTPVNPAPAEEDEDEDEEENKPTPTENRDRPATPNSNQRPRSQPREINPTRVESPQNQPNHRGNQTPPSPRTPAPENRPQNQTPPSPRTRAPENRPQNQTPPSPQNQDLQEPQNSQPDKNKPTASPSNRATPDIQE